MKTNKELITHLKTDGVLKSKRIEFALGAIDRKDFVGEDNLDEAYENYPLSIGYNQTISQPYTVVFMLELLNVHTGNQVLDIGSGSGWTTALLAKLVGETGTVTGLERVKHLVKIGQKNLEKYNLKSTHIEKASKELGIPGQTFDRILVSAAAQKLPKELAEQLTVGGIMVIPVRNTIIKLVKTSDNIYATETFQGFTFVPLIF